MAPDRFEQLVIYIGVSLMLSACCFVSFVGISAVKKEFKKLWDSSVEGRDVSDDSPPSTSSARRKAEASRTTRKSNVDKLTNKPVNNIVRLFVSTSSMQSNKTSLQGRLPQAQGETYASTRTSRPTTYASVSASESCVIDHLSDGHGSASTVPNDRVGQVSPRGSLRPAAPRTSSSRSKAREASTDVIGVEATPKIEIDAAVGDTKESIVVASVEAMVNATVDHLMQAAVDEAAFMEKARNERRSLARSSQPPILALLSQAFGQAEREADADSKAACTPTPNEARRANTALALKPKPLTPAVKPTTRTLLSKLFPDHHADLIYDAALPANMRLSLFFALPLGYNGGCRLVSRTRLRLRAGPNLSDEDIGDIAVGTTVVLVGRHQLADGTLRACVSEPPEAVRPFSSSPRTPQDAPLPLGWVSYETRDGWANLLISDHPAAIAVLGTLQQQKAAEHRHKAARRAGRMASRMAVLQA